MKYLLDIEGTVCPISFVKDILFPYFLKQVGELAKTSDEERLKVLDGFGIGREAGVLEQHMRELVANDVKDATLKRLQGEVWEEGYAKGEIKAPLYEDAIEFIKRKCPEVFIYSSGSVKAQKLLFSYVVGGIDMRKYISGYFDINTSGKKTEVESYKNILQALEVSDGGEVTFLSDNVKELDAAKAAGMNTVLAVRPGNAVVENLDAYRWVTEFSEL